MKKIISILLVISIISSTCNIASAKDISKKKFDGKVDFIDEQFNISIHNDESDKILNGEILFAKSEEDKNRLFFSTEKASFDSNLLTSFNTLISPKIANGANEPKFSYDSFIEENISDYSGELTLNFEDLVLKGRNGLDLRIGRTYQTVASNVGEKYLAILPAENGYLENRLLNKHSNYLLDRYNLGIGWGFSFPSLQIETEYSPKTINGVFQYEKSSQLYYHTGNGEVYQVQVTADETDSNLKGYYKKDIKFDYDNGYANAIYSLTLADKKKQYFAEDGKLLAIVDRFGNNIKFEYTMKKVSNIVPDGSFACNDGIWTTSESNGTLDARIVTTKGRFDQSSMFFIRHNENDDSFILSQPIQVIPESFYTFEVSTFSETEPEVEIEMLCYDTAYNLCTTKTKTFTDGTIGEWCDYSTEFSIPSNVRYVALKIKPSYANNMYIDNVVFTKPQPLISKITDSIGRTVEFTYSDNPHFAEQTGNITVLVTAPDGVQKTLNYERCAIAFQTDERGHKEERLLWGLAKSTTSEEEGECVSYRYTANAGAVESDEFTKLYAKYDGKDHAENDAWVNKLVLNSVIYKDRCKKYEYEVCRKHLGEEGYYDTFRIKKKYEKTGYAVLNEENVQFMGEVNPVNYTYSGIYDGTTFDNETGYPNYYFDEETQLNEIWKTTKSGKSTDTISFSNCIPVEQTKSVNGLLLKSEYTNHDIFKDSPIQIKNTVAENGSSRESYIVYNYNNWGGIASETKEVPTNVKNNTLLLEKYTTEYEYEPNCHYITRKSYYNNIDSEQVCDINEYDTNSRIIRSVNSAGEKISYLYENEQFPFIITSCVQKDPSNFHNVIGGDKVTEYIYDEYGLFPVEIREKYGQDSACTQYEYDYITGNFLKETLPDNSFTEYEYYGDVKIKNAYSPYTQYASDKLFYTIENHLYNYNVKLEEPTAGPVPVYNTEQIARYRVLTDNTDSPQADMYAAELNFYDAAGNLKIKMIYDFDENPLGRIFTYYYYDEYDRLIKTVDNENNMTIFTYDGFDRPVSVTDSENNVYSFNYDTVNNKVNVILNGATENSDRYLYTEKYDLYGNVIERLVYPENTENSTIEEKYKYDLNNNIISYISPKGYETKYVYDAQNRLIETILPDGSRATSSYSTFNEPAFEKIYSPNGEEKLARISYRNEKGDLKFKMYNFDKICQVQHYYNADSKGRNIQTDEGINTKQVVYYDETDNPVLIQSGDVRIARYYNWFGEMWAGSSDNKTTETMYAYDGVGNLYAKAQFSPDSIQQTISYTYSSLGNIISGVMPSGRTENYTYTKNGNLNTIVSDGKTFDYDYYDTGFVKSINYPNGLKTVYEYDNINRIIKLTTSKNNSVINTFEYEYDGNGNTTKETRNGEVTSYSYDSLNRLVSVTYSDGVSVSYEYDGLNNRTKETYSNGGVKEYVYNDKYQLVQVKNNNKVTDSYSYNKTGALASYNGKPLSYNEWDKLTGYNGNTYEYDTNGIRTQKNNKHYVIDINNNVIAETDSTGTVTDEVLWGHQPLARKINGSWYYYIYNAHGDVVGLVNDAGTVVNTYEYTPWGEIRNETETVDNPIKYAGEYYDDELGMIYLRARYYNPQIGRFTSLDIEEGEISNPLDMNRYVYCRNNPIKYTDPSGKSVTLTIGGITIAGAAIVKGIVYLAGAAAGLIMAADLGKKVGEVLKTRKGSIQNAPKPPGTPGWDAIRDLTMAEILRRAQKGETGFKTIWKLLNDGRFKK